MNVIYSFFSDAVPFLWADYKFMINALLAVVLIAPLMGILGTMAVNNKMAFFSDALGHSAFTGIALGVLLGIENELISLIAFGVFIALLITRVKNKGNASSDTVISVFSSSSVALGLLVLSYGLFYGEIILLKHLEILGTTDASLLLIPVALFLFLLVAKSNLSIKSAPYFRKMSTFIFCSQGTVNLAGCLAAKVMGIPFTYVEFLCSIALIMILGSALIWLQKKIWLKKI